MKTNQGLCKYMFALYTFYTFLCILKVCKMLYNSDMNSPECRTSRVGFHT